MTDGPRQIAITIIAACGNCDRYRDGRCKAITMDPSSANRKRRETDWCDRWKADEETARMIQRYGRVHE